MIALHVAQTYPGAQFYVGCAQVSITGGGSANPPKVALPGAYQGSDPGITINIYNNLQSYTAPGPAVCSASDKLFADAAREEAEEQSRAKQPSRLTSLENEHENWDGDERMQDAVLRMLVDKYKPLRTGSIQSADQKLKLAPPG
ncbi:hypothetical protein C0992_009366, partial [Termitomyces sp. T32_za158]